MLIRRDPRDGLDPEKITEHSISLEVLSAALTVVRSASPDASGDAAMRLIVREHHRVGLEHRSSAGRTTGPGVLPYPLHGEEHIGLAPIYTSRPADGPPSVILVLEGQDETIIITVEGSTELLPDPWDLLAASHTE